MMRVAICLGRFLRRTKPFDLIRERHFYRLRVFRPSELLSKWSDIRKNRSCKQREFH